LPLTIYEDFCMKTIPNQVSSKTAFGAQLNWGLVWLALMTIGAVVFFRDGFDVLLDAWSRPEYSHGPLIPILSAVMFLRDLRDYPPQPGPKSDRWQGLIVVLLALSFALLGVVLNADSFVAYAMIVWVGGILLQLVSSELGVWFLRLAAVPVHLDGNIIDLGVLKLHVAEACSGLRYLFPILSFSYIFAFLYQGPKWHKVFLLLAAAPIAVFMNSVRIAMAGILMQQFGAEWLEGFTHFFEGWVIFMASVVLLFILAWLLAQINPQKDGLLESLDLDTDDIMPQFARLKLVQPSKTLITATLVMTIAAISWPLLPERETVVPERFSFALFPSQVGEWRRFGAEQRFSPEVERGLAADDYAAVQFRRGPDAPVVDFFSAWYADLSADGVQHTPEICVQKDEQQMLVYYWFNHMGYTMPRNTAAKISVLTRGLVAGRRDGAILRLVSEIDHEDPNGEQKAEAEMNAMLKEMLPRLPQFIPGA